MYTIIIIYSWYCNSTLSLLFLCLFWYKLCRAYKSISKPTVTPQRQCARHRHHIKTILCAQRGCIIYYWRTIILYDALCVYMNRPQRSVWNSILIVTVEKKIKIKPPTSAARGWLEIFFRPVNIWIKYESVWSYANLTVFR